MPANSKMSDRSTVDHDSTYAEIKWKLNRLHVKIRALRYGLRYDAVGDPLRVYEISPERIRRRIDWFETSTRKFAIVDGDWEDIAYSVKKSKERKALVNHFVHGMPWRESEFLRRRYREFRQNGYDEYVDMKVEDNGEDVFWEYYDYLDKLYEDIKNNGYKSQKELNKRKNFKRHKPLSALDEIQVCIDEDGDIIIYSGIHRFSIARILDIERIPVRTRVRHRKWQEKREEIAEVDSVDDLDPSLRAHVDHPGLEDIRPERIGS